jgi:hypothetical protein
MKMYLISDCHGNIDGLMRALENHKLFDKHGNRQLDRRHQIFLIGDGANCVEDSWMGDIAILDMVGDTIDGMVMGNHEFPYVDPTNSFAGFSNERDVRERMNELMDNDVIGSALIWDNTLITHAGFSAEFLHPDEDVFSVFNRLEDNWKNRNFSYSPFSSVGRARGGRDKVGGIFWCDFEQEFKPTPFPQIMGHTPRCVRMRKNALCIDVGAKDQETEPFILELS